MAIIWRCEDCGADFAIGEADLGSTVECPLCREDQDIPGGRRSIREILSGSAAWGVVCLGLAFAAFVLAIVARRWVEDQKPQPLLVEPAPTPMIVTELQKKDSPDPALAGAIQQLAEPDRWLRLKGDSGALYKVGLPVDVFLTESPSDYELFALTRDSGDKEKLVEFMTGLVVDRRAFFAPSGTRIHVLDYAVANGPRDLEKVRVVIDEGDRTGEIGWTRPWLTRKQ